MICSTQIHDAGSCLLQSTRSQIQKVDWVNEARLIGIATLLGGVIVYLIVHIPWDVVSGVLCNRLAGFRTLEDLLQFFPGKPARNPSSSPRRIYVCGPSISCPSRSAVRTSFGDTEASIYAWPSLGGVIILDGATSVDFEFLNLNPIDPPMKRLSDQDLEDEFCKRLLLLGAKWWDSEERYDVVSQLKAMAEGLAHVSARTYQELEKEPPPTMQEKRFVRVGWPSSGGLLVAEFDTTFGGVDEEENLLGEHQEISRLQLARTMDERCAILRDHFDAIFYKSLEDYEGYAFLDSWRTRTKDAREPVPLLKPEDSPNSWVRI